MQVRDLAGRVVLEKNGVSGPGIELDVENCKSGIYMVFFISDEVLAVARFIKI